MHPETGEPMEADKFCESFVEASGKEAGEDRLRNFIMSFRG
jgi:hypothetical protein